MTKHPYTLRRDHPDHGLKEGTVGEAWRDVDGHVWFEAHGKEYKIGSGFYLAGIESKYGTSGLGHIVEEIVEGEDARFFKEIDKATKHLETTQSIIDHETRKHR